MPKKIISGGQTGVDRGSLDACLEKKFECGGWCPKGRLAEDGKIGNKYPLMETEDCNYDSRTRLNVKNSDGTLIISPGKLYGGTLLTWEICTEIRKPLLIIYPNTKKIRELTTEIIDWLYRHQIDTINVAGPRASEWEEGYQMSYLLIKNLITKLKETARG